MTIEEELKELMIKKSGSVNKFSNDCGLSTSTVATIFTRGVNKTNINTIIKICQHLKISVDELANGRIVYLRETLPEGTFRGGVDITAKTDKISPVFEKLSQKSQEKLLEYALFLLQQQDKGDNE